MVTNRDTTVLIPVYNTPRWMLDRSLASLEDGQSVIIINDASKKETSVDIDILAGLYSNLNLKVISLRSNSFINGALYAGAQAAETRFVTRLDSDDTISLDICGEDADIIGTKKKLLSKEYLSSPFNFGGITVNREMFIDVYKPTEEKTALFREGLQEDMYHLLALTMKFPDLISRKSNTVYKYIHRKDSASRQYVYTKTRREARLTAVEEVYAREGFSSKDMAEFKRVRDLVVFSEGPLLDKIPEKGK
jgi:glycosyltransferase involved in cell wall biosynthesis